MSLARLLLAIVLGVLVIDFGINSLMFERESTLVVNTEEGLRVAEHLVVARRIMSDALPAERARMARQLSTVRLRIEWRPRGAAIDGQARLTALRKQIVAAEPELGAAQLHLRLLPRSEGGALAGSVLLRDRSVLDFRSSQIVPLSFNTGLLLRFSLPSLLLFALAWWLVRRSFKPLNTLVQATSRVGTDDMELLPEEGQREVRQLVRAFNRMHERIHQLLTNRTQTLLAIGHDLRTPMARLQLRIDGAPLDDAIRDEMADDISEMDALLGSLQIYVESGRETGPAEPLDLATMARSQADDATDHGLSVSYSGPERLIIKAHALSLRRAITNLVQNALRYAGSAEIDLRQLGDKVELTVADRGPGIPKEKIAEVLQPFTRLDEARTRNTGGMGLGLAIVDRIISAEGGTLSLEDRPGGGLVARILLPIAPCSGSARNTL